MHRSFERELRFVQGKNLTIQRSILVCTTVETRDAVQESTDDDSRATKHTKQPPPPLPGERIGNGDGGCSRSGGQRLPAPAVSGSGSEADGRVRAASVAGRPSLLGHQIAGPMS